VPLVIADETILDLLQPLPQLEMVLNSLGGIWKKTPLLLEKRRG
jgi:hypothetical protein